MENAHVYRAILPAPSKDGDSDGRHGEGEVQGWPEGLCARRASAVGSLSDVLSDDEEAGDCWWLRVGSGILPVRHSARRAADVS